MKDQLSVNLTVDSLPAASEAEHVDQGPVTWRDFVQLAKPGIIFSNSITAFGGFWVASGWQVNWLQLLFTMLGTALVMGSGCVLNNYLDRDMDTKMARTQNRALPSGKLSPQVVMWYGIILGIIGVSGLWLLVNPLAALLGMIGLFAYVWIYTAWFKRTSVWSTVVGSFSGAIPPVIGYCAVRHDIDAGAIILFAILFLWQPPHFWALGIRRMEEYRAAGFPLLPVVKGTYVTKISMIRYVVLLVPVSMLLYVYGYVNVIYFYAAIVMGLYWAYLCMKGFKKTEGEEEVLWAKKTFIYSINYLTLLFIIMVLTTVAK
ncbi:heme o synthase [Paenibacillus sp. FSL H8-0034]|uniref:heme o synthase n=1 Tax=Paenibacillus sp. FSL H8-0034 TaxID=2954671 RepID=UPI0030F4C1F4